MIGLLSQPLVSIIVPIYNVEKYLVWCLDSIVNQTYRNLEIILINDGSTDGSGEICDLYEQRDARIHVITQENRGVSAARNAGLDYMEGEYVVFVDSDDYISPYLVEVLLRKRLEYDVPVVSCDFKEVKDGENHLLLDTVSCDNDDIISGIMSRDEVFDYMVSGKKYAKFVTVFAKIYDRKIFEKSRFTIGAIYEDELIFHEIYRQVEAICYIDLQLYAYRQSKNSITRRNSLYYYHVDGLRKVGLERLAFFQEYGKPKYIHAAAEMLFGGYLYRLDWSDKQRLRGEINELKKEMYHITGKRFLRCRFFVAKYFPVEYQFMRKCFRKNRAL